MATQLLIAVAAGVVSAAVALAFLVGVPAGLLLIYLAPLPLMLAGLGLGTAAGTLAGGVGALAAGVMGGVVVGGIYVVIHALPAWLVTSQALKSAMRPDGTVAWYPPGHILSLLATLGGGLFAAAAVLAWAGGVGVAELTSTSSIRPWPWWCRLSTARIARVWCRTWCLCSPALSVPRGS